ncbi:hypothetical protein [Pseudalkalibacillus caeni]|uniref:hypothetical protein n=1 Tax=Exobacillus caeni TaxID=2574798 RepID=UPI0014853472|nr:hypothetical protein [Pseudalkalibacillus caeni]
MTNYIEMAMFIKELLRLEEDYKRCENEFLKKEIMIDIELLSSIISESKSKV